MIDTTESTFERDVLTASHEQPVLVDFWAPWCGPCRALGPMLERLETAYGGKFRLVKVNSDENPELSAQYRVRSIPYVVAFVDGQPVDAFVGALPESQLRGFVDKLLPNPSRIQQRKARELLAAGDSAGAASALRAAIALDPANDAARWDLVDLLLAHVDDPASATEATDTLAAVTPAGQGESRHTALRTRLASAVRLRSLPAASELEARIARNAGDLQARLDLAQRAIGERRYEAALEQLLEVVTRDRAFGDDAGRKTMLAVFELMSDQPAQVAAWRRRLSAALNR
jgi:putative thioredoxin